jgi:hypothetical protein
MRRYRKESNTAEVEPTAQKHVSWPISKGGVGDEDWPWREGSALQLEAQRAAHSICRAAHRGANRRRQHGGQMRQPNGDGSRAPLVLGLGPYLLGG